jgi:hypothetical protein
MEGANISEFTFKILLLFLPGIICSFFVDKFTVHRSIEPAIFIIRALVFGLASYLLYWMGIKVLVEISTLFHHPLKFEVHFLRNLENKDVPVSYWEVLFVCFTSVILGVFLTIESTYKYGHKVCQKLRISKKFGELDLWGYALNSPEVEWVTVRDLREDLIYDGWLSAFSDDGADAELLLRDVSVFRNSTAQHLYDVGALYVSRDRGTITLEFRDFTFNTPRGTLKQSKELSNGPKSSSTDETGK